MKNTKETEKTVTLWTIMPKRVYDATIEILGYYVCDEKQLNFFTHNDDVFKRAYQFMADSMKKRSVLPPTLKRKNNESEYGEVSFKYPVWAWYKFNGKHKKPDLRFSEFKYFDEPMVQIEFSKKLCDILLSDETFWTLGPLNDTICSDDIKETKWYWDDNKCSRIREYIKDKSWNRIFIDTLTSKSIEAADFVQATTWCLFKEDIKKVNYFNLNINDKNKCWFQKPAQII